MTIFPNTAGYVDLRAKRARGEITETELFNALWALAVKENYRTVAEKRAAYETLPFSVDSGKLEYDGATLYRSSKYGEAFAVLEDAIAAYEKNRSYPYNDLLVRSGDFVYAIEPERMFRRNKETGFYDHCDAEGEFLDKPEASDETAIAHTISRFDAIHGKLTFAAVYMMLADTVPTELVLRTLADAQLAHLEYDAGLRTLARLDLDVLRAALTKAADAIYE